MPVQREESVHETFMVQEGVRETVRESSSMNPSERVAPMAPISAIEVNGEPVFGVGGDAQTRCSHWRGRHDTIALRMKCCERWMACFECHRECADHPAEVWSIYERDQRAILCGSCGEMLTISEYLNALSCLHCGTRFNPGCADHYHLYFEME